MIKWGGKMYELFYILTDVLAPIFIMMLLGFVLQKKFDLNLNTLAKLNIYFLVPGFIFVKLYSTSFSSKIFFSIILFLIIFLLGLVVFTKFLTKIQGFDKRKSTTLSNSVLFFNSGNYGIPVNDLVFKSDPIAMSVQVIVLATQNIFTFTYGIFTLQSLEKGKLKALIGYLKMPIIYALSAGILFNYFNVELPTFIWVPANYIADAMIAIALIMLGAQIANIKISFKWDVSYLYIFIRLIGGPVFAYVLIMLLGINGIIAKALFIASAMPSSVNSSIIAQEYNNYPGLAAQLVFLSTVFSVITVSVVIFLSNILF